MAEHPADGASSADTTPATGSKAMHTNGAARGELRSLTGLRGVAAMSIVLFHLYDIPSLMLLRHGYMAVDLFFVLSGFVMTMVYGEDFAAGASLSGLATFIGRRLARVYPAYLVMTVVSVVLLRASLIETPVPADPANVAANLLLIQNWGLFGANEGISSLDGPAWSVSTEMAAYVLFPLLLPLVPARSLAGLFALPLAAAGLLVFVATRSAAAVHQPSLDGVSIAYGGPLHVYAASTCYPLMRCLADFVIGMAAFRAVSIPRWARALERPGRAEIVTAAILALLCLPRTEVAAVPLFGVLVAALSRETSLVAAILASRPLHALGLISYSLYLAHTPFDLALRGPTTRLLSGLHVADAALWAPIALVPPLIGVAATMYALVEKPGRRLLRALVRRQAHAVTGAAPSPL